MAGNLTKLDNPLEKKRQSQKGMEGTSVQNTPSFQISITLFDPTVEWGRIVILCISVLLVKLLYLDYWIWPFWTIYVLLPCQFIKSNLSLSTPNPNKCQKSEVYKICSFIVGTVLLL